MGYQRVIIGLSEGFQRVIKKCVKLKMSQIKKRSQIRIFSQIQKMSQIQQMPQIQKMSQYGPSKMTKIKK